MENVVAFNNELSGLYDSKPPISKAKMAAITKSAMRAIKFYKHVVQSVEKFILKCKPEYKVPGLYVIDSIVRQSRHQFGSEKDVFAPRFARNIKETFANLFRCAPEDKSRIIRVLNLWQKNNVFAPEVIQPIFDLADPNHPIYQMPPAGVSSAPSGSGMLGDISSTSNGLNASMDMSGTAGGDDKHGGLPDLSTMSHEKAQNVLDNSTLRQLEHMQQYLKRQTAAATSSSASISKARGEPHAHSVVSYGCLIDGASSGGGGVGSGAGASSAKIYHSDSYSKYVKSSHEIAYDDDDDRIDENSPQHSSNLLDNNNIKQLLNDPNILRQLQTLQNIQKFKQQEDKQFKMNEMRLQEEAFEKHLQNVLKASGSSGVQEHPSDFNKEVEFVSEEQKIEVINLDGNDSRSPTPDRDRYKRRRSSRSRSRSRERVGGGGPIGGGGGGGGSGGGSGGGGGGGGGGGRSRRNRSRSRSRSRSPRSSNRRRSSRDRDRDRNNRDKERDREHERERRKKGLPDLKKEHLSVCSTTLWVGHLSKLVYQEELSDTFGEYGDIVSIDQIVPRGCAFIVMNRRQDAHKAMQGLKSHKLQGRNITISWAAGKGVKSKEWKDFWDLELGVTYIPWNKFDGNTDLDSLEEGGMFDEDSMPGWMKEKISHMKSLKEKANEPVILGSGAGNMLFGIDTTQPPPGPPPGPSGPPPMMPMIPGQFQMAPPMGGPPRMLGPPMGMSLSGIPMPPNMVPGMPPQHAMMMSTGMMPPGFPPMPGPIGGGGPPPMGAHMGMPPNSAQFTLPPVGGLAPPPSSGGSGGGGNISGDDQMDIEMDEDDGLPAGIVPVSATTPQMNFNQPPPMFAAAGVNVVNEAVGDVFTRNRSAGGSSRWGGRSSGGGDEDDVDVPPRPPRWRENGGPPNFNENRGPRGGGGPMGIPPLDINNPPQRPDFMNDFDNRNGPPRGGPGGGPRGGGPGGAGNHNGDFFPNMPNRFNQPTSLMQMRIPPPNSFNPRMIGPGGPGGPGGGPPMFMRGGQGGPGGGVGGRQQGPPSFFNSRNPFDRDIGGGRGAGVRGGRGGVRGGRGGNNGPTGAGMGPGGGNWSDEDVDDGNNYKRGGRNGPGGNRFRDRDGGPDERLNRERGGRRGMGGDRGGPRERYERGGSDYRDNDRDGRDGGRASIGNRRNSRDEGGMNRAANSRNSKPDTEDDWDLELQEYDAKTSTANNNKQIKPATETTTAPKSGDNENTTTSKTTSSSGDNDNKNKPSESNINEKTNNKNNGEQKNSFVNPFSQGTTTSKKQDEDKKKTPVAESTPLYDELPAPSAPAPVSTVKDAEHKQVSAVATAPPKQVAATPKPSATLIKQKTPPPEKPTPAAAPAANKSTPAPATAKSTPAEVSPAPAAATAAPAVKIDDNNANKSMPAEAENPE